MVHHSAEPHHRSDARRSSSDLRGSYWSSACGQNPPGRFTSIWISCTEVNKCIFWYVQYENTCIIIGMYVNIAGIHVPQTNDVINCLKKTKVFEGPPFMDPFYHTQLRSYNQSSTFINQFWRLQQDVTNHIIYWLSLNYTNPKEIQMRIHKYVCTYISYIFYYTIIYIYIHLSIFISLWQPFAAPKSAFFHQIHSSASSNPFVVWVSTPVVLAWRLFAALLVVGWYSPLWVARCTTRFPTRPWLITCSSPIFWRL